MCEIKIVSVQGVTSSTVELNTIIVEGIASRCDRIKIEIECFNGNQIILPATKNFDQKVLKKFTKDLKGANLGDYKTEDKSLSEVEVPFDGIHLEAVPGKCELMDIPTGPSYSLDADLKIKPED